MAVIETSAVSLGLQTFEDILQFHFVIHLSHHYNKEMPLYRNNELKVEFHSVFEIFISAALFFSLNHSS